MSILAVEPSCFLSPGAQESASSPSQPAPETMTELEGRGEARTRQSSSGDKSHSCEKGITLLSHNLPQNKQ